MTSPAPAPQVSAWNLDPAHSVAEFKVRHMMMTSVKGQFAGLAAQLTLDESDITRSRVEATIEAATINTRDPQRDAHLKSADFFDVEKFPRLAFRSTEVRRTGEGQLSVAGDLTMHGVTRRVVFAVEGPTPPGKDPWGGVRIGISATAKVNRKDFGLTWNAALETGGVLVGDEIAITLELEFIKA